MDDNDSNFFDTKSPLILDKEIDTSLDNPLVLNDENNSSPDKKYEMLGIKDLINIKYLTTDKLSSSISKNCLNDSDFTFIKDSTQKINNDIKEKTILINTSIENQTKELESLYLEKKLLDQNKVQSDIINNQQKLLDNYKKNINEFKFNIGNVKKELNKNIYYNKNLFKNNNKLKSTINHYIENNKKLEDTVSKLKIVNAERTLTPEQINVMNDKIKFYQEENIRLSSELNTVQNNYTTIKANFTKVEIEKNNIYKQIQELNSSLIKTNVVGTPFVKEVINEDSINSKVLNDISNKNLEEEQKTSELNSDLDDEINDIFK